MNEASLEWRPAGLGIRLLAKLIDLAWLVFLITAALLIVIGPERYLSINEQTASGALPQVEVILPEYAIVFGLPLAVLMLFWKCLGTTPGKWIFGLRVVDAATGGKLHAGQTLLRGAGYFLSGLTALGFIWIAFDSQKRGWHDLLAKTLVVRKVRTCKRTA